MFVSVLPLRAVVLQGLFLVIAIAIESSILHKKLRISRKTSAEYAISINLFSTIVGWLIFFFAQSLLPERLKLQFMNYILFNRLIGIDSNQFFLSLDLMLIGALNFILIFAIEITGLSLLEKILQEQAVASNNSLQSHDSPTRDNFSSKLIPGELRKSTAILAANAVSYSLIFILLLLNLWLKNS